MCDSTFSIQVCLEDFTYDIFVVIKGQGQCIKGQAHVWPKIIETYLSSSLRVIDNQTDNHWFYL